MKNSIRKPIFPIALSFDDVLLVPQYSEINSRSEVNLSTKISSDLSLKIPLISTNMATVTGVEMAIKMAELGGMGILHRFETIEAQAEKASQIKNRGALVAASIGIKEDMTRAEALVKAGATVINVDVAHGHMKQNLDFVKKVRAHFGKKITLIGGIAATAECALDLYKAGADCVFVGIGGGSTCTTRIQTGCGLPTFESVLRVSEVAKRMGKSCIAGAGIRTSGDIVKALAAGASAIAAGNIFAGTDEAPGEIIEKDGKRFKRYEGSTSEEEKKRHLETNPEGKSETYVQHIEGVAGLVEYKGPVEGVVTGLLAGIKSGLSYCGARTLEELRQKAIFAQITSGGIKESGAHDIILH